MTKTTMKISSFLFLLLLLATISSCKKHPIAKTVVTTVKGFAIDSLKNKRLPNATIAIFGCKQTFNGISCSNLIDTTKTNSNGEFSITFKSDGQSISFEAELQSDENYDYSSRVALNAGTINTIKITAKEYNFLKTHLIISNNPFDTLVSLCGNVRYVFYGHYLDTNIMNRVMPNSTNYVIYSAWDDNVGRYRRRIDTLQIGAQDTTIYNRTLPNISTFDMN